MHTVRSRFLLPFESHSGEKAGRRDTILAKRAGAEKCSNERWECVPSTMDKGPKVQTDQEITAALASCIRSMSHS